MSSLMSCKDYAERKQLPYKVVLRLAKIENFPAVRIGPKRIYVLAEKADSWFEEQSKKPLDD